MGAGGASGGTAGAGGGALGDAAPADGLGPLDGGVCTDNSAQDPSASAASGTFSGSAVGSICTGGTFAYVESTPADGGGPTVFLYIDTLDTGNTAAHVRFEDPANVIAGQLQIYIGLPAATPGTYTPTSTCGNVLLIATLPGPDPSVCAVDANAAAVGCPAGCQATGPVTNMICTPTPPQITYAALAASDCVGDTTTARGSWTLTLTSLTAEPDDAGAGDATRYRPHGTLTAALVDQGPDAGTAGVTLTLSF